MASQLPDELIIEILLRVPAKSILRFRCVSKRWLALIRDSDFVKLHLNRSIEMDSMNLVLVAKSIRPRLYKILSPTRMYLLDQDIKTQSPPLDLFYHSAVVGSCNGVVCLIKNCDVLLFNPFTREYKIVEFDNELEKGLSYYGFIKYPITSNGDGVYGLGCDSDEYKLVQFISHRSYVQSGKYLNEYQSEQNSKINVYSLNDSSCLTISDIPYCFANMDEWGIYLNGAIHWVAKRINTQYEKLIVSFDIREKVIREFPLPNVVDKTSCVTLGVLGGQLCVFLNFYLEIWVMKNYGLSSSWYKLASMDRNVFSPGFQEENHTSSSRLPANLISSPRREYQIYSLLSASRVLCFSKSGEILLSCAKRLILYNPKQNTSRHIVIPGVGEEYPEHKIITNVASYVPLNSGSYLPVEERGPVSKQSITRSIFELSL